MKYANFKNKPGYAKNSSLGNRMKFYESTTDYKLVPKIPVYVRLDGRSFHSFCRKMVKPFDPDFVATMEKVTKYLHEETNAALSFFQSDEISLVYTEPSKMPFECRLFKIQSVLAGMASSAFVKFGIDGTSESFKQKVLDFIPHFDCRCCQMTLEEAANMILWRHIDSIKNSITLIALTKFSDKQIFKKNGDDKIKMLADIGVDYYAVPEHLRFGAFYRREKYDKELTAEELSNIPEFQKKNLKNVDGHYYAIRSRISRFSLGTKLQNISNRVGFLFNNESPVYLNEKA